MQIFKPDFAQRTAVVSFREAERLLVKLLELLCPTV